jgi:hypothetical protein
MRNVQDHIQNKFSKPDKKDLPELKYLLAVTLFKPPLWLAFVLYSNVKIAGLITEDDKGSGVLFRD